MQGTGKDGYLRTDSCLSRGVLLLLAACLLLSPPVSAKVHIVNGSVPGGTIQDLINNTSTGDSIFLAGGTYNGSLVINRPIVFGALDSADPPLIISDNERAGITLDADGITLNGVIIRGSAENGLLVRSSNNRVSALTISGFIHGIELQAAMNNIFSSNRIVNNSIGVASDRGSRSNIFYLNRFSNAEDISSMAVENIWYSGHQEYQYGGGEFSGPLGNLWEGYSGTDSNGDGIGDTPYSLNVRESILSSQAAGAIDITDRAPLVSTPDSYTLVGSANASETYPADRRGSGQNLNPPSTGPNSGGQQPATGFPQDGPDTSAVPPPGNLAGLILQYWWIIPILIVIAAAGGIWFERSFKRRTPADADELIRTLASRNATIVTLPQNTAPPAASGHDSPYYPVSLPPLLAKKYTGAEYLGEGGVGRVFRATDPVENRQVAIKVPVRFDEITGAQFTKELHIWQDLHHRNIVEVYAANVFPMPYIEMEYCESSLAAQKFPLKTDEAIRIVTGIAEGLKYAHDRGIVHRDIEPENILIAADGTPKITDWGLAKALADPKHTGLISFSLNYAAPEQLAPNIWGDAGKWTDIYQLGIIFYAMMTGRLPFRGTAMGEVTQAILHEEPEPLEISGLHAGLIRAVIIRCIQKDPRDRYQDVAEILVALRGITDSP